MGSELQAGNGRAAKQLQLVMLLGVLIAAGLVLLIMLLLNARRQQDEKLREARQQTADILRTVKEGLFLLDENLVIEAPTRAPWRPCSNERTSRGFASRRCSRGIVSEKTLATALKFVKVLWPNATNEKLVKSINPLGEVEVHLTAGQGKPDTRYLDFEFIACASTARSRRFWCPCPT